MSPRTRVTYAKRQKEQARREKQHAKAQRKLERKLGNQQTTELVTSDQDVNDTTASPEDSPVSQMDH